MQSWSAITRLVKRAPHKPLSVFDTVLRATTTTLIPAFTQQRFKASSIRNMATQSKTVVNGDLNNTEVLRKTVALPPDPAYLRTSLAIPKEQDDKDVRAKLRPFLLSDDVTGKDWVSKLELSTALKMAEADMERTGGDRLKVMVLYGSMRSRYVNCSILISELLTNVLKILFPPSGL